MVQNSEIRIEVLERQIRILKTCMIVIPIGLLLLEIGGSARWNSTFSEWERGHRKVESNMKEVFYAEEIQARRILLLDDQDRTRMELSAGKTGPAFIMSDSGVHPKFAIVCADENEGTSPGIVAISLYGENSPIAGLVAKENGEACLIFRDNEGRHRAALAVDSYFDAALALSDGDGVRRLYINAPESGEPSMDIENRK